MKDRYHFLLLVLLAAIVGIAFLEGPGFGDDLTYWSFGFDLHERGLSAWQRHSFHDLRWPVWGVCWVLQGILGFGITSYYGEPLFYLALGTVLSFWLGRKLLGSIAGGWACAVAMLFQPLLDPVVFRPMPDLSEGMVGAAVMCAWWLLMHAESRRRSALLALLTGIGVFILESNRVTGAFIVPVLILNTLLFFPRRIGWLVAVGAVAAACYAAEMCFYHRLFGDWLHNLHANQEGKGHKRTDPIPIWRLPIRFLNGLWQGDRIGPVSCIFAAIGIPYAWMRLGKLGRATVVWFVVLYLEYSCAPQKVWPVWQPMLREADRFLCGLVVPFSLLAVAGLWAIARLRVVTNAYAAVTARLGRPGIHPPAWSLIVVAIAVLATKTTRTHFDLGFVPEFRRYLASLPPGMKVFTHESMRAITFLADAGVAKRIQWTAPNFIMHRDPGLEEQAAQCDEFWYARKLVWLSTRKQLEKGELRQQPPLASYFDHPEQAWMLKRLLAKGDTPDLIFYRRRPPNAPAPAILNAQSPEFANLIPPLPAQWKPGQKAIVTVEWQVPESLRGRLVRMEIEASSESVEGFHMRLRFNHGRQVVAEYILKPYLHAESGKEFFVLAIPADAEKCRVQLRFGANSKPVSFANFRAVVEREAKPDP